MISVLLTKELINVSQGVKSMRSIIALLQEYIKKINLPDATKTRNPTRRSKTGAYKNVKEKWIPVVYTHKRIFKDHRQFISRPDDSLTPTLNKFGRRESCLM